MKDDMNNATSLQRTLDTYCANSGQMVSLASIFFLSNTNSLLRAEICEALHIDTKHYQISTLASQLLLVRTGVIASNILQKELFKG
jgi:hypothetical protein